MSEIFVDAKLCPVFMGRVKMLRQSVLLSSITEAIVRRGVRELSEIFVDAKVCQVKMLKQSVL